MRKRTAIVAMAAVPLTALLPVAAMMYITDGRPRWWMLLPAMLLLLQSIPAAYRAYHLYRTGEWMHSRTMDTVSRVLLCAALLSAFVPQYGPRLVSLFG